MKERPIIFKGEMVRAILEDRKTQTRRVINRLSGFGKITEFDASDTTGYCCDFRDKRGVWNSLTRQELLNACPYGRPGDRLWVKEAFRYEEYEVTGDAINSGVQTHLYYKSDDPNYGKFKSPIFMPRWASRIQLKITDVRVERVQDITPNNAWNEGLRCGCMNPDACQYSEQLVPKFWELWNSINAKRGFGWDENPLVWVIEFERIER